MNGQNLKIAIRRIIRSYKLTLLTFLGLVIGLTSCFIIYTKITYELSFDSSHTQSKNIFRVVRVTSGLEYLSGGLEYRTGVHFPFPAEIKKAIPELKEVTSMFYLHGQNVDIPASDSTSEKSFTLDNGVVFTEPSFFDIFDFGKSGIKWLKGEGKQILNDPYTAVITEETAVKLFADQDPLGKEIILFGTIFKIGGVIHDFPENTDFPFKILLSMVTFSGRMNPGFVSDWGSLSDNYQCYVILDRNSDVQTIEKKFKEIYSSHADEDLAERRLFKLQALSQVHKDSKFGNYNNRTVSTGLLLAITLLGSFIFLIACFNYSNFFLAETFKQKKQIALKIILGSRPIFVYFQFLTESLLVTFCAILLSLQITLSIINTLYSFIDIPAGYIPEIDISAILFIVLLLLSAGILSTIFTIFNYKVDSLSSLLRKSDSGYTGKGNLFGKSSVILQFVVAQVVIIATLFIIKQIYFINHKDLGYSTENIITAILPENQSSKLSALKGELLSVPQIAEVSYSSVIPAESHSWTNFRMYIGNQEKEIDAENKSVDSSYLNLYSFTFLSGQNFSSADSSNNVIVNREFLTEFGFVNVNDAIGANIKGFGGYSVYIKGVVEDFHSGSLHQKMRPCLFSNNPGSFNNVSIRLAYSASAKSYDSGLMPGDIEKINEIWKKIFPDQVFEYTFLNDRIIDYYKSEYKALNLLLLLASITIFLCILGILGLSLIMNERRIKEIGLRKINGARVSEVVTLLNKDFVRWVIIAFFLACPVAFYAMHKWLQNFAYKTELRWWIFAAAGLVALAIAVLTVSLQSWRAATRNPVEALRYE